MRDDLSKTGSYWSRLIRSMLLCLLLSISSSGALLADTRGHIGRIETWHSFTDEQRLLKALNCLRRLGDSDADELIDYCLSKDVLSYEEALDLLDTLWHMCALRRDPMHGLRASEGAWDEFIDFMRSQVPEGEDLGIDARQVLLGLNAFSKLFLQPKSYPGLYPEQSSCFSHKSSSWAQSACGFLLGVGEMFVGGCVVVSGVGIELASCGAYTVSFGLHESIGIGLMTHGCAQATYYGYDVFFPERYSEPSISISHWAPYRLTRDVEGYAPQRPLPVRHPGIKVPDTDTAHTQLGTKNGRKGKYRQAREWDDEGNIVRDIHFTDHGWPEAHTNPHEHKYLPNRTGGTPRIDGAKPLSDLGGCA